MKRKLIILDKDTGEELENAKYGQKHWIKNSYTLFLAIYSVYYLDIDKLRQYIDYPEETIRRIVILFTYMLSNYIATKDIKNHKDIKMIYLINFIVFLIILIIS